MSGILRGLRFLLLGSFGSLGLFDSFRRSLLLLGVSGSLGVSSSLGFRSFRRSRRLVLATSLSALAAAIAVFAWALSSVTLAAFSSASFSAASTSAESARGGGGLDARRRW